MMRLIGLALAGLLALAQPLNAAGTLPAFSLTPQFDNQGKIAPGCKLYIIQAGTVSTPQNGYQDSGLSILAPNPLTCDATGRLPQFFLADGQIKVRLTDKNGVQLFVGDNLLVVGPSSGGGGGGGTVDPTTILQTGAMQPYYGTGVRTGYVRVNGRTIGSATSGATERANSDTQALFEYLWQTDANLVVSSGRGASANADWTANKTITLPDGRNRAIAALGDMGNSDAALFAGVTFTSGNSITLGSRLGAGRTTLTSASQLPSHYHDVFLNDPGHVHTTNGLTIIGAGASQFAAGGNNASNPNTNSATTGITVRDTAGGGGTANRTAVTGSGAAFDTASPLLLVTIYMKL